MKKESKIKQLLTAKSAGGVVGRIVILLLIPYAYLMLCGLIFDKWLRMYSMTTFIFFSLCALYLAALVLCVFCVIWYRKSKNGGKAAEENSEDSGEKEAAVADRV